MQQNANLNVARLQHESRVEELQQVNAKLLEKMQGKEHLVSTGKLCITRVFTPSIPITWQNM